MARGGYRIGSGRPRGSKNKKHVTDAPVVPKEQEKPEISSDIVSEAKEANLTPLEYMLKVMNDKTETDKARRDKMAVSAAPYIHSRKGEGGKKGEREERAKKAALGRFAPMRPPSLKAVK